MSISPVSLTVFAVDDLEVLDRGLCDPTREVEDIGSGVIIPNWSFVVEFNQVVHLSVLVAHTYIVIVLKGKITDLLCMNNWLL